MKKLCMIWLLACSICFIGCTIEEAKPQKVGDMEYTIIEEADVPEALGTIIEEKKEKSFQISYTLGEELYIAVGYGQQETGGYSIQVNDCYETAETIYLDTTLLGPDSTEELTDTPTYPYVVIKTVSIPDKTIEFH